MAISIYEKQNDIILLKCLAAQRKEYSIVKRIKFLKLLFSVGLVTVLTILTTLIDNDYLSSVFTVLNMFILVVSKNIEKVIEEKQLHAAAIQNYFDACCFNAVSDQQLISINTIFVESEIADIVSSIDSKLESVKNWYSDFSSFSSYKQILYCQNENINWDARLRKFYKKIIIVFAIIGVMLLVIYGIATNIVFNSWMTIISFFLVIADCVYNTVHILNSDIRRLSKLSSVHKKAEVNSCSGLENYTDLLELQKLIYEHRQNCFLIPDFIYKIKKDVYQKHENATAENLKLMEK